MTDESKKIFSLQTYSNRNAVWHTAINPLKHIPMDKRKIGENAGTVWQALDNRSLTWEELLRITRLSTVELASAIGWLARENKVNIVNRDGAVYFEQFQETYY